MEELLVMVGALIIAFAFAPVGLGGGLLFAPLLHYGAAGPSTARCSPSRFV